jgi:hypothetical protein
VGADSDTCGGDLPLTHLHRRASQFHLGLPSEGSGISPLKPHSPDRFTDRITKIPIREGQAEDQTPGILTGPLHHPLRSHPE